MRKIAAYLVALLTSSLALAEPPDCSGINRWPTMMALSYLKSAGITNHNDLNFDHTQTIRLASEKIGKDLYRQIHLVTFTKQTGETIQVITNNDASSEECSMSDIEVYLVSRRFGEQLPPNPSFKRDALKRAP